jgi:hypothetical protein
MASETIRTGERSPQQLHDGGLNPFAITLLLESFQSGPWRAGVRSLSFIYRGNHRDALPFRVTIAAAEESSDG